MSVTRITTELEQIRDDVDFAARTDDLAESWKVAGFGIEAMDPILGFIESHPELDYGSPGALVHFVERFVGDDYRARLLASIARRPTCTTVWMLNRLLNGTKDRASREALIDAMRRAGGHPASDDGVRESVARFLKFQASRG